MIASTEMTIAMVSKFPVSSRVFSQRTNVKEEQSR